MGGEINHSAHGALDKHFINRFTFIVKKNLSNSEFSVNDIAREVGMSKVQVYRKVKALLGYSVNEYIINIRLRTARFLLLHSEKTIAEIADEVGFSSPAYFSTSFKSKFNLTPTELRSYQVSL